ncbi:F-box protein At2g35280-like [Lotus japonicus]|uniref:F-box protein At2g35280-like n=1 Tax=Lotus japonicus TaxID=34305 RepID=UPI00258C873F|nr:F-box protein At2g35280-like [Lotus japonicus]
MTYQRLVKMARSKRRRTRKGSHSIATIKALPRDILVDVIAIVASHSFIDLHNIKVCCKDFLDATDNSYVWRRVSLDKFPLIHWSPNHKASQFLNRCREYENIESLYREGLRAYFNYPHGNIDGLDILKAACQKGHKEATYVYGMILLCSEDDALRKQGLEYMRFLRKSKCVVGSRKKVKHLLKCLWKNNGMLKRNQSSLCNSKSTCKGYKVKMGRWVLLDDDDDDDDAISSCEYCRWNHELEFFYQLFNIH